MIWDQLWFQFSILLAISVGAHMGVAYGLAPRAAVARVERWFETDKGQATIGKAVDTILVPRLEEAVPDLPDAAAIAGDVQKKLEMSMVGAAGNVARRAQSSLEKLIAGAMTTGNPWFDGALAMADPNMELRKGLVKRIATAIRRGGGLLEEEGGIEESGSAPRAEVWNPNEWR